ncbi:MAG: hypothetical protein Q4D62_15625 [Planctomycetia bacterium]|nr:hypothetical protein [Planctomycetia bacterium]
MSDYARGRERPFWVGVDFDGTCVIPGDVYPEIIGDMPGAVAALREIWKAGGTLLLVTSREGEDLKEAVVWFEKHKIPLAAVNENPHDFWQGHRKIYCDILIDDRSVGFPNKDSKGADWETILSLVLRAMADFRVQKVRSAMQKGSG